MGEEGAEEGDWRMGLRGRKQREARRVDVSGSAEIGVDVWRREELSDRCEASIQTRNVQRRAAIDLICGIGVQAILSKNRAML